MNSAVLRTTAQSIKNRLQQTTDQSERSALKHDYQYCAQRLHQLEGAK